jgi:hypothetical protein
LKPAILTVIEALYLGLEVNIEGTILVFDEGELTVKVKMWNVTSNEPHYVNPDIRFNTLVRMANRIHENDLAILNANVVLNKIKGTWSR